MGKDSPCYLMSVRPPRGCVDEKFIVLVEKLPPRFTVTLHALLHSEDGDLWEAFGHYISDEEGSVNVSENASIGGTFDGVEPMGLLWSMRPVPGSRSGLRLRKKDVSTPLVIHLSLFQGHLIDGFKDSKPLACAVAERWFMAPGVEKAAVTQNGIKGTLFFPPGPGPFPALMDLWGGGGGLVEYRSALLASHGFVSLALDYMTPKIADGAVEYVGNDYFEAAYRFLQEHPLVSTNSIAVLGLSFGASVALGMAVYSPVIKPKCLVCVSGSHVMPVNGSLSDVFGEIQKNVQNTRYDEENRVIWRDLLLPIPVDPSKKVDVGQIQCPLLLLVGEDDQNWPAAESAEDMKLMMERSGNSHFLQIESYPGTGHLIEPPYSPHVRASNFMAGASRQKLVVLWGGHTASHCKAQEDAWQKTLAFLQRHLYGHPPQSKC